MDRREFLTRATALGVSATLAHGLGGLTRPAAAQSAPRPGGTMRMQMITKPVGDPRLFDWSEMANFTRGWLEYLVEYNADGTLRGMLLDRWEASDDATSYMLHVRAGVRWTNGDPFTATDVAHNIARWCEADLPGNSMANRMSGLLDPATMRARDGAIDVLDDLTLRITLDAPDITVMMGMADYPAAIVHPSYDGGDPSLAPLGTGPYLPEVNLPGDRQILVRNADHDWWGTEVYGGPYLDRIEYLDHGTDPRSALLAAEAGEIDATYQTTGRFIDAFDALGWSQSEVLTSATIAVRFNQTTPPYDNPLVRRAMTLAVDNAVILELGYGDHGLIGENHHVCPIHPEYAALPPIAPDPDRAAELLKEAGEADTRFELICLDDEWQAATGAAVEAQLRDAGIDAHEKILPGAEFWTNWKSYPFSATEWNMRPLGVQVLALAYKSGGVWNETGFANPRFDALLAQAMGLADADERREVMARLETILQEEAVLIQPFWRRLYRHSAPQVRGTEMHPTFEHHHYKWWIDA
ncbi:ABC transporter substrate-binding protein [Ponticoccus sp. SC2-23]|nr:ABC transporter substrate-binding protein [Ponticoccus sp. SC6-9]MBM1224001.1 ABC transporter substrate-binding protein [Ponticoccus sp. SC6-15]MBM1230220.1 ABC transporter substrate-binding protein [Ponticoccus sp. SC6-38]MBM1232967.1 ABC transporter substrate-binding protein [Ponticoccus sp. SC6-45]MBM1237083.1 ABC transporter substrate-binding protein [Ponticoccus sp. SC6-49]MBM1241978.1 ABC transporter substrate-binding protein [Ponticoccus sp. SC2-64]MBM1246491.1 ABC transporter subst